MGPAWLQGRGAEMRQGRPGCPSPRPVSTQLWRVGMTHPPRQGWPFTPITHCLPRGPWDSREGFRHPREPSLKNNRPCSFYSNPVSRESSPCRAERGVGGERHVGAQVPPWWGVQSGDGQGAGFLSPSRSHTSQPGPGGHLTPRPPVLSSTCSGRRHLERLTLPTKMRY